MRLSRQECPACHNPTDLYSRVAIVSPWIRQITGMQRRSTEYHVCSKCGSGWSDLAYSNRELARLYSDYRGHTYLKIRQHWESSYTSELNQSLNFGNVSLSLRRNSMESLIESVSPGFKNKASIVLDFGGGHGGLIPNWPNLKRKIVLDVSGVATMPEIENISSISELKSVGSPDLVMACGILEHLNSPVEFLTQLARDINDLQPQNSGLLFYFEVPSGVPNRKSLPAATTLAYMASFFAPIWQLYDRLSCKIGVSKYPIRIAEHIQFFSESGLEYALSLAGFESLTFSDYSANHTLESSDGIRFTNILGVVARISTSYSGIP